MITLRFHPQPQYKYELFHIKNVTKASDTLPTLWPRADYIGLLVLFLPDGYAMLMRPNEAETAVHGCYCPDDMAVRMR